MDSIWDDLKEPVREAGQGGQLNTFPELSVAFWRWAIWKIFEAENAPRRGVVAFITNRKFLTGWPYAGLRKMMRERFDRIEIIDLRGDVRRGERGQALTPIRVSSTSWSAPRSPLPSRMAPKRTARLPTFLTSTVGQKVSSLAKRSSIG